MSDPTVPKIPIESQQGMQPPIDKLDPDFQSALVNAWIAVRLEEDKALVTLSAGGIGLLVTLLTTIGLLRFWHVALYGLAFGGFFISICSGLSILRKNACHIELILKREKEKWKGSSETLEKLDRWTKWSFIFGLAMSILLGVILGIDKLQANDTSVKSAPNKGPIYERTTRKRNPAAAKRSPNPTTTGKLFPDGNATTR